MTEIIFDPISSAVPILGALFVMLMNVARKATFWVMSTFVFPVIRPFFLWLMATFAFAAPVIRAIGNWFLSRNYVIAVFIFYSVIILGVLAAVITAVLALYSGVRMVTPSEMSKGIGLIITNNLQFILITIMSAEILAFIYRAKQKVIWEWAKANYNNPPQMK